MLVKPGSDLAPIRSTDEAASGEFTAVHFLLSLGATTVALREEVLTTSVRKCCIIKYVQSLSCVLVKIVLLIDAIWVKVQKFKSLDPRSMCVTE